MKPLVGFALKNNAASVACDGTVPRVYHELFLYLHA